MSGLHPVLKPSHSHVEPSNSAQNDPKSVPDLNSLSNSDQTIPQEIFNQLPSWQQELIKLSGQWHAEIIVELSPEDKANGGNYE